MARTALTAVTPNRTTGTTWPTPTEGDAANGNTVPNDGNVYIWATNTNGAATARTIDFIIKRTVDGVTPDRAAISLADAAEKIFGPFPVNDYGTALDIDVEHADVELIALRLP